jgi:hypothetical protein
MYRRAVSKYRSSRIMNPSVVWSSGEMARAPAGRSATRRERGKSSR